MNTQTNDNAVPVFCTDYREIQRRQRLERLGEIGDELASLNIQLEHRIKHNMNFSDIEKKMEDLRLEAGGYASATPL